MGIVNAGFLLAFGLFPCNIPIMTICKCGVEHNRVNQRYCLSCHAAYMRESRNKRPISAIQRTKGICRSYANTYKRRGKLLKQDCAACGIKDSQMHHPDYSLPLAVIWLCRPCHLKLHNDTRETSLP